MRLTEGVGVTGVRLVRAVRTVRKTVALQKLGNAPAVAARHLPVRTTG